MNNVVLMFIPTTVYSYLKFLDGTQWVGQGVWSLLGAVCLDVVHEAISATVMTRGRLVSSELWLDYLGQLLPQFNTEY